MITIQVLSVLLSFFWTLKVLLNCATSCLPRGSYLFAGVGVFTYSLYIKKIGRYFDIEILFHSNVK